MHTRATQLHAVQERKRGSSGEKNKLATSLSLSLAICFSVSLTHSLTSTQCVVTPKYGEDMLKHTPLKTRTFIHTGHTVWKQGVLYEASVNWT